MGTEKESMIELTERIGRKTGGVSVSPFVSSIKTSPEPVAYLMVSHDGTMIASIGWQRAWVVVRLSACSSSRGHGLRAGCAGIAALGDPFMC